MSRFLCVGDLHLDKGGRYGRVPGERLAEQEQVWAEVLQLARDEKVDAVIFAGDAFEKRHPSTDALLAFERPLIRHDHACPVIAIPGNHDRSGVSDFCALDVFHEAGLLTLHSRPAVTSVGGVSVACLPWAPVSRIVAAHDGETDRDDVNVLAAELLLETARGLRAQSDGPMILLTHFSISGASTPDGMDVGLFREPVIPLADLEAIGFDAIVGGHIHRFQRLEQGEAPIFYVGSPLALDFGEGGYDHGVWILEFDVNGATVPEFVPITSRNFTTLDWGIEEAETLLDLDAGRGRSFGFAEGSFVKLRYTATAEEARRIDNGELRQALRDAGAFNAWIEPQIERPLRARVEGLDETISDVELLEQWMTSQSVNGDQAPALRSLHTDYLTEVGA